MAKVADVFQAMFAATSDAILLVDAGRVIRAMNPAAERLLGQPASAVVGELHCSTCLDCRTKDGQRATGVEACPGLAVLRSGEASPYFELQVRDGEGGYRLMAFSAAPVAVDGEHMIVETLRDLGERLRLERALEQQARDLAVAEERRRLASEIHDSLAQTLSIILGRVRQLPEQIGKEGAARARAALSALERAVQQAHQEVRQAIFDLQTPVGHGPGFVAGLQDYLAEFELQAQLPVTAQLPKADPNLGPDVALQVFRILQEALNNARKHSGATRVMVTLRQAERSQWQLTIADNGRGFDAGSAPGRSHYGLTIMKERARAIGGRLTIWSVPAAGARVQLEFPGVSE